MDLNKSQVKDLSVGDLVTHLLYGKDWVGVILKFKGENGSFGNRSEKALVQIQPGTKFEGFFKQKVAENNKLNDNLGYITTNWLFRIEVKDENTGPSRDPSRKSGRSNKEVP